MAGIADAGLAAGSEILTVQELRIEEIGDLIRRRIGRSAGVSALAVYGDLDHIGRAWRAAMAMRRPTGSAPNLRS
jgi:hypothetical protein